MQDSLRIYFLEAAMNSAGVMQSRFFGIGRCYRSPCMYRLLPAGFHSPQNDRGNTFPFSGCPRIPPLGRCQDSTLHGTYSGIHRPVSKFFEKSSWCIGRPGHYAAAALRPDIFGTPAQRYPVPKAYYCGGLGRMQRYSFRTDPEQRSGMPYCQSHI